MAVLKCIVCGGELEVNADMSVGVCKYCDSTITIPKGLDRKGQLYNRAVFLRQNNEFDKAEDTYEDILKEDNSDAEAHWGLVLSKFGIEYVLDPGTLERIPTCHRTQQESILSDPDYQAAIKYSDSESRGVIEKEAKRIHKIQEKILEISQKEPPYDVFICYKESDELGNRTEDSLLAQDLYYELVKKDYKVFFARKTLESKLGTEYEPIIFAALSSAKVMIVLGTKPDHFNSVWVRNEWSRFSKMSRDTHKVIIPAYRGISPYELPVELASLQSQDMSKLGFMQDLTDGIERCMRNEKKISVHEEIGEARQVASSIERLLQNGETYLSLDNYTSAEEVYITITKEYPEDYRGWWGLIVCKTHNFSEVLQERDVLNVWLGYVKKLASTEQFAELEKKYIEYAQKVALSAASEDMKLVEAIIDEYTGEIKGIEEQILCMEQKCNQEIKDVDKEIEKWNKGISIVKGSYKKANVETAIGGIIAILGGIICAKGSMFLGIIVLASGICVCFAYLSKAAYEYSEGDSYRRKISDEEKKKPEIEKKYNEKKVTLREGIPPLQSRIEECQKYLELGKEQIATIWLEEECKKLGIQKIPDSAIKEYRDIVFKMDDSIVSSAIRKYKEGKVDIKLISAGSAKELVAMTLQDIMGIEWEDAMTLVNNVPVMIKEAVYKEDAENIKSKIEEGVLDAEVQLINRKLS